MSQLFAWGGQSTGVSALASSLSKKSQGWSLFLFFGLIWLFCDPMACSLPDSSVCGISQARTLEWVAISFPKGASQPRDQTNISSFAGGFTREVSLVLHYFDQLNKIGTKSKVFVVANTTFQNVIDDLWKQITSLNLRKKCKGWPE